MNAVGHDRNIATLYTHADISDVLVDICHLHAIHKDCSGLYENRLARCLDCGCVSGGLAVQPYRVRVSIDGPARLKSSPTRALASNAHQPTEHDDDGRERLHELRYHVDR